MLTAIDGHALPQLEFDRLFVTDGGIETDLIFHHGIELPFFAAFPLLEDAGHRISLRRYYDDYVVIARELGAGLVIETPTWRANPDWAARLGYAPERLDAANRAAVELDEGDPNELAAQYVALRSKLPAVTVLGGCCGTDARHVAAICAAWVAGD